MLIAMFCMEQGLLERHAEQFSRFHNVSWRKYKMNIWLINHYAVPTKYYPLGRPATFAKYLMRAGHKVTIFAASTVHNSSPQINLIEGNELYKEDYVDGIHYVYVKCSNYEGNGKARIINMFQFPQRLPNVVRHFKKPNAIVATSVTPMACTAGLKLAKKYHCKGVAEVADLWPETFVALGAIKKGNLILAPMYTYERRMYELAEDIVFTMPGARQYLREKHLDLRSGGPIDFRKTHYINNGVDLEVFDQNAKVDTYHDTDLDNPDIFKVVYTGSIRRANMVEELVKVAQALKNYKSKIKILIWGAGDQVDGIQHQIESNHLENIALKGKVDKMLIPQILAKSDLNIFLLEDTPLYKYGLSLNKMFEYFASGKPVLANSRPGYSIIDKYNCGISMEQYSPELMAEKMVKFAEMSDEEYKGYCVRSRRAAQEFDFNKLTERLIKIINS